MPASASRPGVSRAIDPAALAAAQRRAAHAAEPPWLHREVARRMAERLAIVKLQPELIVDWWARSGAGAALLAKAYPRARRIDVEPEVVAARRGEGASRSTWWRRLGRDARASEVIAEHDEPPAGAAQLLWSNMMLHAAPDPPSLLRRWQRALAGGGFVMFSCLGPGTLRQLRALYRDRGWGESGAEFVDMHDLGDMLIASGFADPVMDQETLTLSWPDPQALLAELRTLGGNASPARCGGLRTPRWRERLLAALGSLAGADGRPRLDVEIVYGHAFKSATQHARDGEAAFAVDELRAQMRARRRPEGS